MRCQEVRSLVNSYFDGQIDEYTKIKVHHHLAGCKTCTEDYNMWSRGEEFIRNTHHSPIMSSHPTKSLVMDQVMERINQEEKWAKPSVKSSTTYTRRTKRLFMVVSCMLMLFFIILLTSTLQPQLEVNTEDTTFTMNQLEETWEFNTIVLKERVFEEETSMNFQVVSSIHDPIIYTLQIEGEGSPISYPIIFSFFGFLCIIISLSWITRV